MNNKKFRFHYLYLIFALLPAFTEAKSNKKKTLCAENICAKKIKTQELKSKEICAQNVHVTGDLTIDGEIIPVRNNFHGWWRRLNKYTSEVAQLMYIDAINPDSITITTYDGDFENVYQTPDSSFLENTPVTLINDRVLSLDVDASVSREVDGTSGTFPQNYNNYFTIQEGGEYDGLLCVGDYRGSSNESFDLSAIILLYEKLDFEPVVGDQIRPWGNGDNMFKNANSRRFMFEQLNNIFFDNGNPALSPFKLAERLMPRPQRLTLFNAIMNDGVERDAVELYTINKSTKGSGTTTLFVKGTYPFVSYASKVTLSGLEGDWADLNGEHQVLGVYNTDNENVEEQAPFYLTTSRLYHILINVDSQDKPIFDLNTYAPNGALIKPSNVGPITEDIQYREFADAAIFYTIKVMQQSTHSGFYPYCETEGSSFADTIDARLTKSPLANWEDVTQALAQEIASVVLTYRYKGYFGSTICPPYYLPYWETFYNTQINEPFEELGVPGSDLFPGSFPAYAVGSLPAFNYNVPFENYLLPDSRRWLYFRVKPDTPITNDQQKNVWALAYDSSNNLIPEYRGYASVGPNGLNSSGEVGGSRLEGLMSPVPWGDSDASIEDGFWSPYTNSDPSDPTTFNAGIINPDFVGGRKIGYIFFISNILFDPYFIGLNSNFGNPNLAISPDLELRKRQQYDGEAAVISELMRYFVEEQEVEAMIIDNRINGGGYNTFSLIESFGGSRPGGTCLQSFQNQDNRNPFNTENDMQIYSGTQDDNKSIVYLADTVPWTTVRPDLQELRYPNSVFKNGPVIILDSQYAVSGGDQFPRYFIGENEDGNIGENTMAKIVGSIDGILEGYSADPANLISSKYGSEFPQEIDGELVGSTPLRAKGESLLYNEISNTPSSTRLTSSSNYTTPIPALVPVNSNGIGPIYSSTNTGVTEITEGALSTNIQDTVYFDFGYTGQGQAVDGTPYAAGHWDNPPVGIDQVGGFPGQPNPADVSSLRDSWLEEAIRVIRICLGDTLSRSVTRSEKKRPVSEKSAAQTVMNSLKCEDDVKTYAHKKENRREFKHNRLNK